MPAIITIMPDMYKILATKKFDADSIDIILPVVVLMNGALDGNRTRFHEF